MLLFDSVATWREPRLVKPERNNPKSTQMRTNLGTQERNRSIGFYFDQDDFHTGLVLQATEIKWRLFLSCLTWTISRTNCYVIYSDVTCVWPSYYSFECQLGRKQVQSWKSQASTNHFVSKRRKEIARRLFHKLELLELSGSLTGCWKQSYTFVRERDRIRIESSLSRYIYVKLCEFVWAKWTWLRVERDIYVRMQRCTPT